MRKENEKAFVFSIYFKLKPPFLPRLQANHKQWGMSLQISISWLEGEKHNGACCSPPWICKLMLMIQIYAWENSPSFWRSSLYLECEPEAKISRWLRAPCLFIQYKVLLGPRLSSSWQSSARRSRCLCEDVPQESSRLLCSSCWRYINRQYLKVS